MILLENFSLTHKTHTGVIGIGVVGLQVSGVRVVHGKSLLSVNPFMKEPKVRALHIVPA
jgi:hypothetical protein